MKIEINEQPSNEPLFPAFYKDRTGDLWFWTSNYSGVCISDATVHGCNDRNDVNFEEYDDEWEFVRVHGTITITV